MGARRVAVWGLAWVLSAGAQASADDGALRLAIRRRVGDRDRVVSTVESRLAGRVLAGTRATAVKVERTSRLTVVRTVRAVAGGVPTGWRLRVEQDALTRRVFPDPERTRDGPLRGRTVDVSHPPGAPPRLAEADPARTAALRALLVPEAYERSLPDRALAPGAVVEVAGPTFVRRFAEPGMRLRAGRLTLTVGPAARWRGLDCRTLSLALARELGSRDGQVRRREQLSGTLYLGLGPPRVVGLIAKGPLRLSQRRPGTVPVEVTLAGTVELSVTVAPVP